ncbi:14995_t:CDS:2, partial [Funneliformis mosseae]
MEYFNEQIRMNGRLMDISNGDPSLKIFPIKWSWEQNGEADIEKLEDLDQGLLLLHTSEPRNCTVMTKSRVNRYLSADEKDSLEVNSFWNNCEEIDQQRERKRKIWKIESADWDYLHTRDQQLSKHVKIIRENRCKHLDQDEIRRKLACSSYRFIYYGNLYLPFYYNQKSDDEESSEPKSDLDDNEK